MQFGKSIDGEKTHIVRSELVLDARVPEPDDQLHSALSPVLPESRRSGVPAHRNYFLPLSPPLSPFSAGAAASASVLPFLMTSGSAGPAAASAATASAAGATSSLTAVTCTTVC